MIAKYRAWVKTEKRMIETDDILGIDYENKEIVTQQVYFENGLPDDRDIYCYDFDDIILMQSTAFKNKNGKEIFEGDIVQFFDSLYTVFYDIKEGCYRLKPHDDRWVVDYMCNFSSEESFEVVSNIYENKE